MGGGEWVGESGWGRMGGGEWVGESGWGRVGGGEWVGENGRRVLESTIVEESSAPFSLGGDSLKGYFEDNATFLK